MTSRVPPPPTMARLHRAARRGVPYAAALATIIALAALVSSGARSLSESLIARQPEFARLHASEPLSAAGSASARSAGPRQAPSGMRSTGGARPPAGTPRSPAGAIDMSAVEDELIARHLTMPVSGARPEQLSPGFAHVRNDRTHEALDIMAAHGTPVVAVEDGRLAKLFWSDAGGHTLYQFDPSERFAYYYAHLDRYADGLTEGSFIARGQVVGYVGSTGNARADAPHLHFAIFVLTPEKRWWEGTAVDPYPILRWAVEASSS